MRSILLFVSLLFISFQSFSQELELKSGFLKDSVRIGEPVELYLSSKHPQNQSILFPDSAWNYEPFEFISKHYTPTKTQNGISRDCTVYLLRTFEVNEKAVISLPIFQISQEDTITINSNPALLRIHEMIKVIPEAPELKEDVSFSRIPNRLNIPMLSLVISLVLILGVGLFTLFGKPIRRNYRIIIAILNHRNYTKSFEQLEKAYNIRKDVTFLEKLLGLWKNYLTRLEAKPINSYTSTEIISLYGKEDLKTSLTVLDRAIFGGIVATEEDKAIKSLKSFSTKRYIIRKNEIRRN